ncbi:MAG: mitochondrial fission ELM1 family protein [Synergistaceae bacterium]|jgi:mitochondrial fission protein ELM1|nr:mitochondrial fission ELM1 family protein [Synergistaceae bacterium]
MFDKKGAVKRTPAWESQRLKHTARLYINESDEKKLRLIVIISDGIRGHVNQSRGVAAWLSKGSGAEIQEMELPELKGVIRRKVRKAAVKLIDGDRHEAREWLSLAKGEGVVRALGQLLLERDIREGQTSSLLLLSAGSMPAFFNLALGYIWRCACATIMTPSIVGTDPFHFAIVPEHDYPGDVENVMATVGAPNLIVREELGFVGESLLREFPPKHEHRWGILVGGNDKNYRITAEWMQKQVGKILREAARSEVDLYIATSRRTPPEAENALRRMVSSCENTRFLLVASSDPFNPVPAILGACDEIFVTDDSVNMVSEAVTAGHRVILLRTERVGAVKQRLQLATSMMVSSGILSKRALWGVPRFDETFLSFKNMGLLIDFRDWIHERRRIDITQTCISNDKNELDNEGFNEARRAAGWILSNLPGIIRPEDE